MFGLTLHCQCEIVADTIDVVVKFTRLALFYFHAPNNPLFIDIIVVYLPFAYEIYHGAFDNFNII